MWKQIVTGTLLVVAAATGVRAADFQTQVTAEYTFSESAPAKVELTYTLVNTNAAVFVQNYQIVLPDNGISGLVVQQKDQQITKQQHADHERQILDLTFENEVVGQGKRREFEVEYSDRSLLARRGGSSLIQIAPLPGSESFDRYDTIVRLPVSFGEPELLTPEPVKFGTGSGQLVYSFDQRGGETIKLGFGQRQVLQFELDQTLTNIHNTPAYQAVTFPGDRDDIQLLYSSLQPTPDAWQADERGDWQGIYLLGVGETRAISASGYLLYERIDQDFRVRDHYPGLEGALTTWNIADIPEDLAASPVSVSLSSSIVRHGFLPVLDRYQFSVHNHTGRQLDGLHLVLTDPSGRVHFQPQTQEFALPAWQKSVIISRIRGDWWRPYTLFAITAQVVDAQGAVIDEHTIHGLSLSYPAFAGLGALSAIAGVAGSVLVDGRRQKRHLRRQGEKPQESA